MKVRTSFISNSSASSFVIMKFDLSQKQINMIKNHIEEAKSICRQKQDEDETYTLIKDRNGTHCEKFGWFEDFFIEETDDYLFGHTSMDNFDMSNFLQEIGVNSNLINWDDGYYWDKMEKTHEEFIRTKISELRNKKLTQIKTNKDE